MSILVDTCVWSLALRRSTSVVTPAERTVVAELRSLITEDEVRIIGPVRQELLSGVRDENSFNQMRSHLQTFPDEPLVTEDFELAAQCCNQCRSSGIAGSAVDMLICAAAIRRSVPVFTTDQDVQAYAEILGLQLYLP